MRKMYCDICCKEIKSEIYSTPEEKKAYFADHRNGRFSVDYAYAALDRDGDITHFESDYDFHLCPDCADRIDKAVWKEINAIMTDNRSMPPAFPKEPRRELYCESSRESLHALTDG